MGLNEMKGFMKRLVSKLAVPKKKNMKEEKPTKKEKLEIIKVVLDICRVVMSMFL